MTTRPAHVEASDILRLLHELGHIHKDPICRALSDMAAANHTPVLELCYAAIETLAQEKARMQEVALDALNTRKVTYTMVDGRFTIEDGGPCSPDR